MALGLRELQARARGAVEHEVLTRVDALKPQEMVAAAPLGLPHVVDRGARCADGEILVAKAEALQGTDPELFLEDAER